MHKKIKELTPKEIKKLNKMMDECEIITFNKADISKRIGKVLKKSTKAHADLLKADEELLLIIGELYGTNKGAKIL